VTGGYYLVRNTLTIPSALLGGSLYAAVSPAVAFGVATVIGLFGTGFFLVFGQRFRAGTTHGEGS